MNIIIRRLVSSDALALSVLAKQTFYDTFVGKCSDQDMQEFLDKNFNVTQLEHELSSSSEHYFFAELDGLPVGYLQFKENYESFPAIKKWKAVELKRIYVLKELHGKGVAQKLIHFILQFALENNFEVVFLSVWEHNYRARVFYEKIGFENSGHTHLFPIGNTPQMDCWYWKFI